MVFALAGDSTITSDLAIAFFSSPLYCAKSCDAENGRLDAACPQALRFQRFFQEFCDVAGWPVSTRLGPTILACNARKDYNRTFRNCLPGNCRTTPLSSRSNRAASISEDVRPDFSTESSIASA